MFRDHVTEITNIPNSPSFFNAEIAEVWERTPRVDEVVGRTP
jgi:hypothetical protein